MSRNDITNDKITTGAVSDAYRDRFDAIFKPKLAPISDEFPGVDIDKVHVTTPEGYKDAIGEAHRRAAATGSCWISTYWDSDAGEPIAQLFDPEAPR